jgi:hypothetical protein
VSWVLDDERVGLEEVGDRIWQLCFGPKAVQIKRSAVADPPIS